MKKQIKQSFAYLSAAILLIAGATSCKKEISGNGNNDATPAAVTTATSSTITVAATAAGGTASGSATDSVMVIHKCEKGERRDSIAASALPTAVQNYVATNYSGNSFVKAFSVKDTTGAVKGYVVIINFNGKPVALQFKADGTFVKVLEQREKGDMDNKGWHRGGRFEKRDGEKKDTVALSALPAAISAYFAANFAGDTLTKAFKTCDSGYLVISKNNGVFASLFNKAGVFVKRVDLPKSDGVLASVAQSALPTNVQNYLSTTYPNYAFDKADSVTLNGVLKGYIVIIDANNTRYCVAFDASGNFVAVKTIW